MIETKEDIIKHIKNSPFHMAALRDVRSLKLEDCWISAGFVRNYVWDCIHGYDEVTPLNDIDVIYYDANDLDKDTERQYEVRLHELSPGLPWSVKNQARMHLKYGNRPYTSISDALTHWCETPTPVAIKLDDNDDLLLVAPLGLDDLLSCCSRATDYSKSSPDKMEHYYRRMNEKEWQKIWPKVKVHDLN